MRRNNGTFVDPDANGPGIPGFTDGNAFQTDIVTGLPIDASHLESNWTNDTQENVKRAAIEGNGAPGPQPSDPNDDPFELTTAVNSAANTVTGTADFVAAGLRFTTGGGTLLVTQTAGIFAQGGQKYHASLLRLGALIVEVDGVSAGNGTEFTLLASRDHYVSIGTDGAEDALQIQVRDVALGAPGPAVPPSTFVYSVLSTDGAGVTEVRYPARGAVIQTDSDFGQGLVVRSEDFSGIGAVVLPVFNDLDIGARSTAEIPDEALFGRFFKTIYLQRQSLRSYRDSGRELDRSDEFNATTTTSGAVTSDIPVVDLDDFPNSSTILIEVSAAAFTDLNQSFGASIAFMGQKTSAGVMSLVAPTQTIFPNIDPGAIAATVTANFSGANQLRVRLTGAVGHDMTWVLTIRTTEMRAI